MPSLNHRPPPSPFVWYYNVHYKLIWLQTYEERTLFRPTHCHAISHQPLKTIRTYNVVHLSRQVNATSTKCIHWPLFEKILNQKRNRHKRKTKRKSNYTVTRNMEQRKERAKARFEAKENVNWRENEMNFQISHAISNFACLLTRREWDFQCLDEKYVFDFN